MKSFCMITTDSIEFERDQASIHEIDLHIKLILTLNISKKRRSDLWENWREDKYSGQIQISPAHRPTDGVELRRVEWKLKFGDLGRELWKSLFGCIKSCKRAPSLCFHSKTHSFGVKLLSHSYGLLFFIHFQTFYILVSNYLENHFNSTNLFFNNTNKKIVLFFFKKNDRH